MTASYQHLSVGLGNGWVQQQNGCGGVVVLGPYYILPGCWFSPVGIMRIVSFQSLDNSVRQSYKLLRVVWEC